MPQDKMTTEKVFTTLIDVLEANGTAWEEIGNALQAIAAQVEQEPAACIEALQFLADRTQGSAQTCRTLVQDSRDTLPYLIEPQRPPKQASRALPFRQ